MLACQGSLAVVGPHTHCLEVHAGRFTFCTINPGPFIDPQHVVGDYAYEERAWTYQEKTLSFRSLLFLKEQVMFCLSQLQKERESRAPDIIAS
jgi:hypothetical protein